MADEAVEAQEDAVAEEASAAEDTDGRQEEDAGATEDSPEPDGDRDATADAETEAQPDAPVATAPAAERVVEQRGPGFAGMLVGGLVAGAIGFAAAYFGLAERQGGEDQTAALEAALSDQGAAISELAAQTDDLAAEIEGLAAVEPAAPDLSGIEGALADVSEAVGAASARIDDLVARVEALEARPILSGEGGTADEAAIAAAIAELQEQIGAERRANETLAAEIEEMAAAAAARVEEAEARIAAAEERAAERVGTATAQAALSQLRIAVAAGNPFSDALADVSANSGVEVPETLAAAAETGIPTLEELQARFPAAARAALPVALRETAGEDPGARIAAFLRGQVGGRSLEPRDGDDPDAILSRAEAALDAGDVSGALSEIEALPEAAQAELAAWTELARTRAEATEALDAFAAALDGAE